MFNLAACLDVKYIPKDVGLAVDFSLNGVIIISEEVSGMYTVCWLHLWGAVCQGQLLHTLVKQSSVLAQHTCDTSQFRTKICSFILLFIFFTYLFYLYIIYFIYILFILFIYYLFYLYIIYFILICINIYYTNIYDTINQC